MSSIFDRTTSLFTSAPRAVPPKALGDACVLFASTYYFVLTNIYQRLEAHLESIHEGEDGEKLCASTPYDFFGQHFDHPDSCANWVSFVITNVPSSSFAYRHCSV
jgi:hypothetical protein